MFAARRVLQTKTAGSISLALICRGYKPQAERVERLASVPISDAQRKLAITIAIWRFRWVNNRVTLSWTQLPSDCIPEHTSCSSSFEFAFLLCLWCPNLKHTMLQCSGCLVYNHVYRKGKAAVDPFDFITTTAPRECRVNLICRRPRLGAKEPQ